MDNEEKLLEIKRKGFIWNFLGSVITAISSVMTLMIVKRFAGIEVGAYYSIAVAVSNVMINIGTLNVIGFQISDIREKYSFNIYLNLRKMSIFLMLLVSLVYVLCEEYSLMKGIIVYMYCIYRAVYAYADVFQGRYQQKGRVDLAGKMQFMKVLFPDGTLIICTIVSGKIIYAIICAMIVELTLIFMYNKKYLHEYISKEEIEKRKYFDLLWHCLPLFFSAFATTYIMNSSKYAIDKLLSNEMQVYYSILLLPATVVHMIAGFIYRPVITDYAALWENTKIKNFVIRIIKVIFFIFVCTIVVEIAGVLLGIPILEWLYAAPKLREYVEVFVILLLAGGLNALNTFMIFVITIMRAQNHMVWIYGIALAISIELPEVLIKRSGMVGAATSYLLLMVFQLSMIFIVFLKKLKCKSEITNLD